jgi:hypothetical protein
LKNKLKGIRMTDTTVLNSRLIDALVVAYNARDARSFADMFAEDAWHGNLHSTQGQQGREQIYRRYVDVFATYPENRTEVIHRAAYGRFVVDHERVRRSTNDEPFNIVAVYTIDAGRITRLDFVRD